MQMTEEREGAINSDEGLEWKDFTPHPAGIWRAEFRSFKKAEPHPQFGQRLQLHFVTEAQQENGEPCEISVFTSMSLGPKARVRPMLVAMGVKPEEINIKGFKLSAYLKRQLVLVIEQEPRKDGQGVQSVIKSFQPLSSKPAATQRPNFEDNPPPEDEQ